MKTKIVTIGVLNELLSEKTREKFLFDSSNGYQGVPENGEGYQGEYNKKFKFYKHPGLPENVFLKVTIQTDSYGDNESITEYQFVEGKAKQITVFEPIK